MKYKITRREIVEIINRLGSKYMPDDIIHDLLLTKPSTVSSEKKKCKHKFASYNVSKESWYCDKCGTLSYEHGGTPGVSTAYPERDKCVKEFNESCGKMFNGGHSNGKSTYVKDMESLFKKYNMSFYNPTPPVEHVSDTYHSSSNDTTPPKKKIEEIEIKDIGLKPLVDTYVIVRKINELVDVINSMNK